MTRFDHKIPFSGVYHIKKKPHNSCTKNKGLKVNFIIHIHKK
jgi:hypothetical protein